MKGNELYKCYQLCAMDGLVQRYVQRGYCCGHGISKQNYMQWYQDQSNKKKFYIIEIIEK